MASIEHGIVERNGKHLIWPTGAIVALRPVDHIAEISPLLEPKSIVECPLGSRRPTLEIERVRPFDDAKLVDPSLQKKERVEPQRVNLHGFSAAWGDHPVVDLGIHPRQLVALCSLPQKTVVFVDADAEACASDMAADDLDERRQQHPQRV